MFPLDCAEIRPAPPAGGGAVPDFGEDEGQPGTDPHSPLPLVIVKVAARCNLNCTYCYEFNLADQTWKDSPALMSEEVFDHVLRRVRRHAAWSGQTAVNFSFHGGEPCLLGPKRFDAFCRRARQVLGDLRVKISLQTNGTLLNADWVAVLAEHEVNLGISLDGPRAVNDACRVDHRGRGSYDRTRAGMDLLRAAGIPFGILTVIPLGADPLTVHRHFLDLGCQSLSYLMPDYTHDTITPVRAAFGPTPCADFLIPVFDDWWLHSTIEVRIRNFWDMARMILGGDSHVDALGNRPLNFVVVNSAGDIEGLDVLKACADGLVKTGLNVRDADFRDLVRVSALHGRLTFGGMPLPHDCRACPERVTCGGGYHPHRYSRQRGFDNASVWCADLLQIFGHIRGRLGVSVEETDARRRALRTAAAGDADGAVRTPSAERRDRPAPAPAPEPHAQTWTARLPAFLTWELEPGLPARVRTRYRGLLAARFGDWLDEPGPGEAAACDFCRPLYADLPPAGRLRFLDAPVVGAALVGSPGLLRRPRGDYFRECLLAASRPADASGSETAPARAAAGGVALEAHGVPCPESLAGLVEHTPAELEAVARRVAAGLGGAAAVSDSVAALLAHALVGVVVRKDPADPRGFSSSSWPGLAGQMALINAHRPDLEDARVIDALVHEAIHGLLYMTEAFEPFYLSPDAALAYRATSPWTGRSLYLHSYVHACFVWFGLWCFWSLAGEAGHFPGGAVDFFRDRARQGFLGPDLLEGLGAGAREVAEVARQALAAAQQTVRRC